MNDQTIWFYEQGGTSKGPVSGVTIKSMVASGVLFPQTLIWREGLGDWLSFQNSELCEPGQLMPPALGPLRINTFTPRPARLNPEYNFGIFESLGVAWNAMCADFWPFVGFYALVSIIYGFASNLFLPIFFLTFPLFGGFMYYTLKRLRGQTGNIENMFDGFKRRFGSLATLSFIGTTPLFLAFLVPFIGFMIFAGTSSPDALEAVPVLAIGLAFGAFLLLGVAGLVLATISSFAALLCLDCDIGWTDAMRLAARAYGKHFFKLTVFSVIMVFLSFAGILVFFVGSFVTGAWCMAALSHVYEKAFGDIHGNQLPGK